MARTHTDGKKRQVSANRVRALANKDSYPAYEPGSNEEVNVGLALRGLRAKRKLTLRALSEESGLAVNTLSLIENGKTSPSVSTLQQLAIALEVPITAFFQNDTSRNNLAYLKAGQRRRARFTHGTLEDLGPGLANRTIEPFIITIRPKSDSGPQLIVHNGQEFVFCLEGRIVYTVQDRVYPLEPGDSLLFEAQLPHRWQNIEAEPAKTLMVLCALEGRDQHKPVHFVPDLGLPEE